MVTSDAFRSFMHAQAMYSSKYDINFVAQAYVQLN